MRLRSTIRLGVVSLILALPALGGGCSSSSNSGGGGGGGSLPQRSTTCLNWQKAECSFLVGKCTQLAQATCDDQFQALFCKDDATMQKCITALGSAACGATPTDCQNVADPTPAVNWCNSFVSAACDRAVQCKQVSDKATCESQIKSSIDCTKAAGVKSTADECMAAIPTMDCNAQGLPAPCSGVLLLLQ